MIALMLAAAVEVAPFLDEAQLKAYYRETGAYARYNTKSAETYTETQNPLAAVMGLYRHEGLFTDEAFKDLRKVFNRETKAWGLRDDTFGDLGKWKAKFAKGVKLKDAKTNLVEVKDNRTFQQEAKHLEKWIGAKHAVLWVREATTETQDDDNRMINGGKPFPLTVALVDGIREGELHVVWPRGHDRRYKDVVSGWHDPKDLFYDVKRSVLIYWAPERKLK